MRLFYIRNLFSASFAEQIIKDKYLEDSLALIKNDKSNNYYNKISKSMDSSLWIEILKSKLNIDLKFDIFMEKKIKTEIDKVINYYTDKKIDEIYLSNIFDSKEKVMYMAARDLGIKINFYEEGVNIYRQLYFEKNRFKKLIKKIMAGKYRDIYKNPAFFKADNLYCSFPDKYYYNNYNNIDKISPNFQIADNLKSLIDKLNMEVLFLSRPLSEDGLVSYEKEKGIMRDFLKKELKKNSNIYIKFHPREDESKINDIRKEFGVKELPDKLKVLPAEKIVFNSNINTLVGFETGTLAYASELTKIRVYSLLNKIDKKPNYLKNIYNFYKEEFSNINF